MLIFFFLVNGTNVVQPNILLNNGVMHLIDGRKYIMLIWSLLIS